jgi:NADPH2:quinone reductase
MKAVVVTAFGGPEHMQVAELDMPEIQPKQVLIRVESTSVNFADIKSRYGKKGAGKLPFVPGLDAAGVVERVGSGCGVSSRDSGSWRFRQAVRMRSMRWQAKT